MQDDMLLKTTPPVTAANVVFRARLAPTARRFTGCRVVTVVGRSGFGKSALLSRWRRDALNTGAMAAWVSLDETDVDTRFASAVAAAIAQALGSPDLAQHAASVSAFQIITMVLTEVLRKARPLLLVLDDVHRLPTVTVSSTLSYLLTNLPPNMQVLMASRHRLAGLQPAAMPHGQSTEVDEQDLKLRLEETQQMLQGKIASPPDGDLVARVHGLTEGWPLGVQLIASTLNAGAFARLPDFEGVVEQSDLGRYLLDELARRMEPDLLAFLVRVSVTENTHADLARSITLDDQAGEKLRRLVEATPLISAMSGGWVRIHALAKAWLQARVDQLPPLELQRLHSHAARWLAASNFYHEAARHARIAGDDALFDACVSQALTTEAMRFNSAGVLEWGVEVILRSLAREPQLYIAVPLNLAYTALAPTVLSWLPTEQDYSSPAYAVTGWFADAARIAALTHLDRLDEAARILERLSGLIAASPVVRMVMSIPLAYITLRQGLPARAGSVLDEAQSPPVMEHYKSSSRKPWKVDNLVREPLPYLRGFILAWEGRLREAQSVLEGPTREMEKMFGRESVNAVNLAASLASMQWCAGRSQEAALELAGRMPMLDGPLCLTTSVEAGFITSARIACEHGEFERALGILERLAELSSQRLVPRVAVAALREMMHIHFRLGHVQSCNELMERLEALWSSELRARLSLDTSLPNLHAEFAAAFAAGASGRWRMMEAHAATAQTMAASLKLAWDDVQARLIVAYARDQLGESVEGLLREAESLARLHGFSRIVEFTHPTLNRTRLDGAGVAEITTPASVQLTTSPAAVQGSIRVMATGLLTPKEQELLQMLIRGLSNKEMGRAAGLSEQTVKWHLKNLFNKLQVGTRRHAVDRATVLGLVEIVR